MPFLDPYNDVRGIRHVGPIVTAEGDSAEITVDILEFNLRDQLLLRKAERIVAVNEAIKGYRAERDPIKKDLRRRAVLRYAEPDAEYSAMVRDYLEAVGFV
jgi:hypothetical protein